MGDRLAHLDASVLIALVDASDAHHESSKRALIELEANNFGFAVSAVAYMEAIVGPKRAGTRQERIARKAIEAICPNGPIPISADIADAAAGLRVKNPWLKSVDAMIVACANTAGNGRLVTNDKRLARFPNVLLV